MLKYQIKSIFDNIKSRLDVAKKLKEDFHRDRQSQTYQAIFEKDNPLVSVCVATYNRAQLLTERCLPSLLAQTYSNIEIVVVGDHCTDDTALRIRQLNDPRISFTNLDARGVYPKNPKLRWMVAGTKSLNHALDLAKGDFITHLDDDDEHIPSRIEQLLRMITSERLDMLWHPFNFQSQNYEWHTRSCDAFEQGSVTTSSVFYHHWLKRIPWDINAYKFYEPGDWNRFRKFRHIGVNAARNENVFLKHYRERSQQESTKINGKSSA